MCDGRMLVPLKPNYKDLCQMGPVAQTKDQVGFTTYATREEACKNLGICVCVLVQ